LGEETDRPRAFQLVAIDTRIISYARASRWFRLSNGFNALSAARCFIREAMAKMGLQLSTRLRCAECGGSLLSLKPWRQADVIGKPEGRRG